jgi:phosphatidylglycerophosphate synthase
MPEISDNRRPVKSRGWKSSQLLANWLATRNVSPNGISVAGMAAGIVGGMALVLTNMWTQESAVLYLFAAICMQLRLQANLLDGMVAIQSGKASRLGELFNEVPDRVSDTAFLAGAGYSLGCNPQLGLWASMAAMATAYLRTTARSAGTPMDFCGPMAKQHRMAVMTVACLLNAIIAWNNSTSVLVAQVMTAALWIVLLGSLLTCGRRIWRAAQALQAPQVNR